MALSGGVNEPVACIRLISNVSYVIECICLKEMSAIFCTTLVNFLNTAQTFFIIEYKLILRRVF